ncbi:uncharacterized protein LOC132834496 [Hemiscyllium ocellatum]|uniref:uncharacterized protein LOC132834496 n=1 Tax=Hemiscyllium ocellatum TaxID=170820 RepID=UPI0029674E8C|nr:uncharacterized protein LOC132834496 [Hemiscyllium ocellatum]
MVTMCFPPTLLLLLTLTPHLLASGPSVTPIQVLAHTSVSKQTSGRPPEVTTPGKVENANNTEPQATRATTTGVMIQDGGTPEVTTEEGETSEVTTAEGEISGVMTPGLTTRQRSTITTTTTTERMTQKVTSRTTRKVTSRTTLQTTSMKPSWMRHEQQISVKVTDPPSQMWIVLILCLVFITLLILLVSACRKLQDFGGQGSYYPCHLDRERYVNAEEGEGTGDGQPRAMRWVFLSAVRRMLPWRSSPLLSNDENDEEAEWEQGGGGEEGVEGEVVQGRGSSEAQPEGDSQREDTDHSDSDDYSSLGGLDLRERAVREEESEEKGQEEGSGREPSEGGHHSPSGDELLSDIHSFSGTAQWSDTNHDITAL